MEHGKMNSMTTWILGTSDTCDVRVADEYVSNRHAQITRDAAGRFYVVDLGSMNGTYLQHSGQRRVRVYALVQILPGDTLWLGDRTAIPWTDAVQAPIHAEATIEERT